MTPTKPQRTASDDIDLVAFLERGIIFFRDHRLHFLVAAISGILLGLALYFLLPKVYGSRMMLHNNSFLTNSEQIQIIDNWNELLKKKEYEPLVLELGLPESTVKAIKKISAAEVQKVFTPNNPNGFYVDVRISENSLLPAIQNGIVFGINNTEYVKERVAARRSELNEMIQKLGIELTKLDSTKTSIQNIISNKEKNSSYLMVDVSNINRQWIDLNEKLLGYRNELKFSTEVIVLQSFSQFKTPVSPGWKLLCFLGLVLALVVCYIFLMIRSINRRIKRQTRIPYSPL
jgi:hypothetical protein